MLMLILLYLPTLPNTEQFIVSYRIVSKRNEKLIAERKSEITKQAIKEKTQLIQM
jgi:hypothetical protein